ncbi:leucine-rich repeat-containing protein 56-like, partial [Pteropus vampyrus]|uniref:Leucine-rich repeat-containing protein 56-like n=2 Tax=Pteropus vampyrus TaxID=132908 RepID=A0A6P3S4F8_PTEVA
DLGTSLGRLRVLWLARCGLVDLDGIGSLPALEELYVSYNSISDLSPLCLLEQLEVLDLEGNSVEDLGQVRYLQLCPRLATLTLEGNLVCLRPSPGPRNE